MDLRVDHQEIFDLRWSSWQLEINKFNQKISEKNKLHINEDDHSCNSSVSMEEEAIITMNQSHIQELKYSLDIAHTKLKESVSQRAILESVISERLESERAATTSAKELKSALLNMSARCSELTKEKLKREEKEGNENISIELREARIRFLEEKLCEVEAFLLSDQGQHIIQLESDLASAKLAVAELESDKDELEQQLNYYIMKSNQEEEEEEEDSFDGVETTDFHSFGKLKVSKSLESSEHVNRKPLGQWNGQNRLKSNN